MPPNVNSKSVPLRMSQNIVFAKPPSYLSSIQKLLNFGLRIRDYNVEIKVKYSFLPYFFSALMSILKILNNIYVLELKKHAITLSEQSLVEKRAKLVGLGKLFNVNFDENSEIVMSYDNDDSELIYADKIIGEGMSNENANKDAKSNDEVKNQGRSNDCVKKDGKFYEFEDDEDDVDSNIVL